MADQKAKSAASRYLDAHPELRQAMSRSKVFADLKSRAFLKVYAKPLYIIRGDALGGEDDLYLDALAEGARPQTQDELSRALFLELDDDLKAVIIDRLDK